MPGYLRSQVPATVRTGLELHFAARKLGLECCSTDTPRQAGADDQDIEGVRCSVRTRIKSCVGPHRSGLSVRSRTTERCSVLKAEDDHVIVGGPDSRAHSGYLHGVGEGRDLRGACRKRRPPRRCARGSRRAPALPRKHLRTSGHRIPSPRTGR